MNIKKKEKGVSPVIATILMVAITVVLAATVYIMVSGFASTSGQTPLAASLTYIPTESTATKAVLQVTLTTPSSADFTKVRIVLKEGVTTGSATLSSTGSATVALAGKSFTINVLDLDGNGKLSTGDQLIVDGGTNNVGGITVIISVTGYSGNAQTVIPS